jgi:hypothetical protein
LLNEEIAELRHKETEAFVGCIVGVVVFIAGFMVQLPRSSPIAGITNLALLGAGLLIMIINAVFSQYYSNQRKKLMMKTPNMPNTLSNPIPPPPPSNICPTCHHPLTFIDQYKAWYCFNCKEYK